MHLRSCLRDCCNLGERVKKAMVIMCEYIIGNELGPGDQSHFGVLLSAACRDGRAAEA
jgi:hypothetical protein